MMKLDHIDVDVQSSGEMFGFDLSVRSIPSDTCFVPKTSGFISLRVYLLAIRSVNVLSTCLDFNNSSKLSPLATL